MVVASIAIVATLITSGNTQTKAISGSPASDTKDNQWLKFKKTQYIQTIYPDKEKTHVLCEDAMK